mgnify:CR=1 FL=1
MTIICAPIFGEIQFVAFGLIAFGAKLFVFTVNTVRHFGSALDAYKFFRVCFVCIRRGFLNAMQNASALVRLQVGVVDVLSRIDDKNIFERK